MHPVGRDQPDALANTYEISDPHSLSGALGHPISVSDSGTIALSVSDGNPFSRALAFSLPLADPNPRALPNRSPLSLSLSNCLALPLADIDTGPHGLTLAQRKPNSYPGIPDSEPKPLAYRLPDANPGEVGADGECGGLFHELRDHHRGDPNPVHDR